MAADKQRKAQNAGQETEKDIILQRENGSWHEAHLLNSTPVTKVSGQPKRNGIECDR